MAEFTCPPPLTGLIKDSPAHIASLCITVLYPFLVVGSVAVFIYNRNSSVFLRKRPIDLMVLGSFSTLFPWFAMTLYDYVGPDRFPCAFGLFMMYVSFPTVITPLLIKLARYRTEVSISTLAGDIDSSALDDPIRQLGLESESSFRALAAHLRLVFCKKRRTTSQNRKHDRVLNAKFQRSQGFLIFWFNMISAPFLTAYVIRLAVDPVWHKGCYGCDFDSTDCAVLVSILIFSLAFGLSTNSLRVSKRDALRIVRECLTAWLIGSLGAFLSLVLVWTDPYHLARDGHFSWRMVFVISVWPILYITTLHQVIVSRVLKHTLVVSNNFNRNDRFEDVMNDKKMKADLKSHLNSELSSEILLFLEAVDNFRAAFLTDVKEARKKKMQYIHNDFIVKSAVHEVNLSSTVRETMLARLPQIIASANEVDMLAYFDSAYDEVKDHLLKDGFTRFLNKVKAGSGSGKVDAEGRKASHVSSLRSSLSAQVSAREL